MARFCLKIRKGLTTIWGGTIGRAEADMASAKSRAEEVQALIAQRHVELALAGDEFHVRRTWPSAVSPRKPWPISRKPAKP